MAFTIRDYNDLVRLLREHPEWQDELRQLLLSDELLALPETVQQLVRAQQRTEERLLRLEETVQRLVEQVEALVEGQKRIIERVGSVEERVGSLEEGQKRLIERMDTLEEGQKELRDTVGGLKGRVLEISYRNRAFAYFGTLLRRAKATELQPLEDEIKAVLSPDEFSELILLDLLVTGKLEHVSESPDIFVAVEVSSVVDKTDVSRAVRRASLLRKAGYQAVPAVAGEDVTQGANKAVREQNVVLVQNGRVEFWKEALANWEDIQLEED